MEIILEIPISLFALGALSGLGIGLWLGWAVGLSDAKRWSED